MGTVLSVRLLSHLLPVEGILPAEATSLVSVNGCPTHHPIPRFLPQQILCVWAQSSNSDDEAGLYRVVSSISRFRWGIAAALEQRILQSSSWFTRSGGAQCESWSLMKRKRRCQTLRGGAATRWMISRKTKL